MSLRPDSIRLPSEAQAILDAWWLEAREVLAGRWQSLVLLGSVAQADFCPGWSDVDVCVFLDRAPTAEQEEELRALDEILRERFVERGEGGWRSTQTVEPKFHVAGGEAPAPFDRLQVSLFGVLLAGADVALEAPGRNELVADVQWLLDDLERAPGDFSPIRLAGLMQEAARQLVFWRDGALVSKTEALEAEIAEDGPHSEAYGLALALRREGSSACAGHLEALRRHAAAFAPFARTLLLAILCG